jgi:hypothetical protein
MAYYCGGYVAGRMARFDGLKQGVAVWLWTIIIATVLTIVGLIAGTRADVLSGHNSVPRIAINGDDVTAGSTEAKTRWSARLAQIVDGFGVPHSPGYLNVNRRLPTEPASGGRVRANGAAARCPFHAS